MLNTDLLKAKRVENRYTQKSLASKLRITSTAYRAKELKKRKFNIDEVFEIALALKLSIQDVNLIFFNNKITDMLNDNANKFESKTSYMNNNYRGVLNG